KGRSRPQLPAPSALGGQLLTTSPTIPTSPLPDLTAGTFDTIVTAFPRNEWDGGLIPFGGGLRDWPSSDPEVDLAGRHCRIRKYFLPGNAEDYECPYEPFCRLRNASGLSFRLVDGDFDSYRMAAGVCGLGHSVTVPPRRDK